MQDYYSKPVPMPSKSEPVIDPYYNPYSKPQEYINDSNPRNPINTFIEKSQAELRNPPNDEGYQINYNQNLPPKYENENFPLYNDKKYQNPYGDQKIPSQNYEEPKYEEQYYENKPLEPNYSNENMYQKYKEPTNNEYSNNDKKFLKEKNYPVNNYSDERPEGYQDDKYEGQYSDEIEKLKLELKRKEEEYKSYQQSLNIKASNQPKDSEDYGNYSRINKALFDRQKIEDQRKFNSMTLDYQISEKSKARSLEMMEKEKEQAMRLEMLKKIKEDEARERQEKMLRVKEYRDQLEVQTLVKSNMNYQEKLLLKSDVPRPNESPPRASELGINSNGNSQVQKFTKKTPKTICYNPITGVLRDTSHYTNNSYPSYNIKDSSSAAYYKSPEIAANPAFYQQQYTKNHPKIVSSFPVTGNNAQAIYNRD